MSGFRPAHDGGASSTFVPEEITILSGLATQITELIEKRSDSGPDAAVQRLFPDAYRDNADNASEFRRFTEDDLAERKIRNARAVLQSLEGTTRRRKTTVELDASGVASWLRTLTDLRLTLATRLGIEGDGTIPPDADAMNAAIYDWLGYLQETLVQAIDR